MHLNEDEIKTELKLRCFNINQIENFVITYGKEYFGPIIISENNQFEEASKMKFDALLDPSWHQNLYEKYFDVGYAKFYIWFYMYMKFSCQLIDQHFELFNS